MSLQKLQYDIDFQNILSKVETGRPIEKSKIN